MDKNIASGTPALREGLRNASGTVLPDGRLSAHARMKLLFDEGTFVETGAYIGVSTTPFDTGADDEYEPVVTGYGSVDGVLVFAFSQDGSRDGGAFGEYHARKLTSLYKSAQRSGSPIVGVFDSAGAKVLEGVAAPAGYAEVMRCVSESKCINPQIAVISGPCGGADAVIASMFDFMVTSRKSGSLYMAPPSSLTDKTLTTPERLASDGVSSVMAEDDASAVLAARRLVSYFDPVYSSSDTAGRAVSVDAVLASPGYDVATVVNELCDAGSVTEISAGHAKSMFCALASVNSHVCGIVATNPVHLDGALCSGGATKAADFIGKCSLFGFPVITIVDGNGVSANDHTETRGILKRISSLASAYALCESPLITVITGRAFGTAYSVLGSKALGADIVFALDSAVVSAMSPDSAVEFLGEVDDESKHSETAGKWAREAASPLKAAKLGLIDDIIESSELRDRVAAALEMLLLN